MEISEIKARLSIEQVLRHYGITINRNGHIQCDDLQALQILKPLGDPVSETKSTRGYLTFGKGCIIFPLKNSDGRVCSLYGRKIDKNGHYYLTGRSGLYPNYPAAETKRLLLVESIIDAATLLQIKSIKDQYSILALYGTNGLTAEHQAAIESLEQLESISIMLDGDEAGRKAGSKIKSELSRLLAETGKTFLCSNEKSVEVKIIELPTDTDVNELWVNHQSEDLFLDLLNNDESPIKTESKPKSSPKKVAKNEQTAAKFNPQDPNDLRYQGEVANYGVKGFSSSLKKGLDSLKITLVTYNNLGRSFRSKVELYEDREIERYCKKASLKLDLDALKLEIDLGQLTEELERFRAKKLVEQQTKKLVFKIESEERTAVVAFLKAPKLLQRLNELIGMAGIVGEERNRLLLYIVASSYKQKQPLHALIQGSSGSGKTLLLRKIMHLLPEHIRHIWTRITEKSLYHAGSELKHHAAAIEDWDGVPEEVQYVWRELQTGQGLSSFSTQKIGDGDFKPAEIFTEGPISSLMCTTQGAIYEDNMSRCFLVAVDESEEQTQRILEYQYAKDRGEIDKSQAERATRFMQVLTDILKPMEIVNPYAGKVILPSKVHKIRRLNDLYQIFVQQVCWLHQYQRKKDKQGRLIVEKSDLKAALDLLFDSIVLKVDELDGSLRQFFEQLKAYVMEQGGENRQFSRREIREALNIKKVRLHNYLQELQDLEYIQLSGGYANRGYQYKIKYWDDNQRLRRELKTFLDQQLNCL